MHANLSDRQLRFVFEYLLDQNACAAAVRAGYSRHSRKSAAHSLMGNPAVLEAIRVELQGLVAEAGCSVVALVKERARGAFFRAGEMFGAGWDVLAPDEMGAETRAALQVSVAWRGGEPTVRLRQPDRDKALRALERLHERLEEASERYYATLEEEDLLAEVEALEREVGEVEAALAEVSDVKVSAVEVNAVKVSAVEEAAGERARGLAGVAGVAGSEEFSEMGLVLSGAAGDGVAGGGEFVEKGRVLSGADQQVAVVAGAAEGTGVQAGNGGLWRAAGLGRTLRALFPEKGQVLSGSPPAAVAGGAGIAEKSGVLSGSAGVAGAAPQGGLGAATSLLTGRPGWGSGALRVG